MSSVRKYFPVQGNSIMTASGEVTSKGLSAKDLKLEQVMEMESLVDAGILRADGEYSLPRGVRDRQSFVPNRLTREQREVKPYSDKPEERLIPSSPTGGVTLSKIT